MTLNTTSRTQKQNNKLEDDLTSVILNGMVVPWSRNPEGTQAIDYKLISLNGLEYFIVADPEWRDIFARLRWEEVKVVGLLNISQMTVIPQKVYPKGPRGQMGNVIDEVTFKGRDLRNKILRNVSELVLLPLAVWAVIAA